MIRTTWTFSLIVQITRRWNLISFLFSLIFFVIWFADVFFVFFICSRAIAGLAWCCLHRSRFRQLLHVSMTKKLRCRFNDRGDLANFNHDIPRSLPCFQHIKYGLGQHWMHILYVCLVKCAPDFIPSTSKTGRPCREELQYILQGRLHAFKVRAFPHTTSTPIPTPLLPGPPSIHQHAGQKLETWTT